MTISLDGYYDRFDAADHYDRHLFRATAGGSTLQAAELNEIQSALIDRVDRIGDAALGNVAVVSGCGVSVNASSGLCTCASGQVYVSGAVRSVASHQMVIAKTGSVSVGVYVSEAVVTEAEDAGLLDPAIDATNYQEPGAARLRVTLAWGYAGDGQSGTFVALASVSNAVVTGYAVDNLGGETVANRALTLQGDIDTVISAAGLTPSYGLLTQLRDAIRLLGNPELPMAALDFPTVATATNRLAITKAAVVGKGGRISFAAGTRIALAEEAVAGATGRMRMWTTASFSADLTAANTDYYLRASIVDGIFTPRVVTGADSDAAGDGGGDSSVFDVLLAKIETGALASEPTVTPLANAARLFATHDVSLTPSDYTHYAPAWDCGITGSLDLDWARTPKIANISGHVGTMVAGSGVTIEGVANQVKYTEETRYALSGEVWTDWSGGGSYNFYGFMRLIAMA